MRVAVITILLLTAMYPLVTSTSLDESPLEPQFTGASGVDVISEVEPNNVNTSGQEVYPGDVVRGTVDMWDDKHDWFKIWLEPGQDPNLSGHPATWPASARLIRLGSC